ncbi:pyridoxal-dependent decarboxylase [Flagelloscypha sp. PMI_526]|nr:pyridoxal-dependent decarboxylase [Flagelloscypha sp. PMI_526]
MTAVQTVPIAIPGIHNDDHIVETILSSPTSSLLLRASVPRDTLIQFIEDPASTHEGESVFPSLPLLFRGSPDVHLNRGIADALRLVAEGEPDAERAFFVADLSVVYKAWQRWTTELPDIRPFYAVKCNPDPYVLRLLASLGTGFDCASNNEINAVLSLTNGSQTILDPTSNIIFANPCKASSFIRSAASKGVHMTTFDNSDELHKIKRTNPKAQLVLRILTDDSKSLCQLGLKFGAPLGNVLPLLRLAKELELEVIGVAFHVGSGNSDPTAYKPAIALAKTVFNIGSSLGYKFRLLDIGGGFEDHLFEDAARCIREALEEWFPDRQREGVKVISEPGRFFVGKAFKLACCIIARRLSDTEVVAEDTANVMYYINDGVYGSFNCTMFDHQIVHPYPLTISHSPVSTLSPISYLIPSSVWGPTCDSIDLVSKLSHLPSDLEVGDWLGFDNMGAYTICAASGFNGFERSNVVYTTGTGEESNFVEMKLKEFRDRVGC